ncbi:MAG: polyprenyl synthetase family protein [Bacteroidetes bacterium]|nr:MAG: polyprenyl synthetase family protein [Bacteroidota bacterium]
MQTLSQIKPLFEAYIHRHTFNGEPAELYVPVNYIMQLGGKRMRPVLLLMACELFDDDFQKAMPAAFAIEVFHNFTLVHDDIMDEAPIRRGNPAIHTRFGLNAGILSGDVMLILAYQYLAQLPDPAKLPQILAIFNRVAVEVCEGQQRDMNFETRSDVQIDEYLEMIRQKTAVLLGGAMQIGALIGGATPEQAQHLYHFAENIGLAFQIQDDLLDTFGDPEKFGKKVGGDIIQNKKTFLLLKAFELANDEQKQQLTNWMSQKNADENAKVEGVKKIYNELNVSALAESLKQKYQSRAFEHLRKLQLPDERLVAIKSLADSLLSREI